MSVLKVVMMENFMKLMMKINAPCTNNKIFETKECVDYCEGYYNIDEPTDADEAKISYKSCPETNKNAKNYILSRVALDKKNVLNVIKFQMAISLMIQKEYVIANVQTKQEIMKAVKINV